MKIVATGASFEFISNKDSIQKIITNAKDLGAPFAVCYWRPHAGDNFTSAEEYHDIESYEWFLSFRDK